LMNILSMNHGLDLRQNGRLTLKLVVHHENS
jgi:hypothetical protein